MIESKSSAPAQPTTRTSREDRARNLARDHHHEIAASHRGHEWEVPSCTGVHSYRVTYSYTADVEPSCECPDFAYRHDICKHILAAALLAAGHVPADTSARVDEAWIMEASELTGFECRTLAAAFLGTPRERRATAVGVLKHTVRAGGTVEEQGDRVRSWARHNERGTYHLAIVNSPPFTFGGKTGFELSGV